MVRVRYLTLWLAAAILAVFALQQILRYRFAWEVGTPEIQFLLSILSHSGVPHLLGNLFALGLFGLILEGRIGSRRLGLLFLAAGVVGNLAGLLAYDYVLGASGAIYGILGALAVLRPRMVVWLEFMPMPMLAAAAAWTFVDVLGLFAQTQTGHLAHLAGLFVGVAAGFLWKKRFSDPPKRRRTRKKDPALEKALDRYEERFLRS